MKERLDKIICTIFGHSYTVIKRFDFCNRKVEKEKADWYDNHTSNDVIDRLRQFIG